VDGIDPSQIRRKRFDSTRRGFDPQQVTAFLEEVADGVAALMRTIDELGAELNEAREKVADVMAAEEALQLTILTATKARDEMLARAERDAGRIRAEAQMEVAKMLEERRVRRSERTGAEPEPAPDIQFVSES